jgi:hypothetical protein
MLKLIFSAILAFTMMTPTTPTLVINPTGVFTATFDAGAVWASISLTSHSQTIVQDGKEIPYVVHFNYELDKTLTSFDTPLDVSCTTPEGKSCPDGDDWDIVLSVGYPEPNKVVPTTTDVNYVDSEVLTLHHN